MKELWKTDYIVYRELYHSMVIPLNDITKETVSGRVFDATNFHRDLEAHLLYSEKTLGI